MTSRAAAALLALAACAANAADWSPSRPVRFISVFPAGGSVDAVARVVGQRLAEQIGQQVVIDNRPGAGGAVGVEIAARAAPDGHTIVIAANSMTSYRVLNPKLTYDPLRDVVPVSLVAAAPLVLCSTLSLPVATGAELLAYIRARPGKLNFASSGPGTSAHLAGELFRTMAKLDLVHVPYKGAAPAITDLIAGQVQIMFSSTLSMVSLVQGGKLKGLGVTSAKRLPVLPEVPAVAEFLPGYELSPWFGVFVPAGTPKPVIARYSAELKRVLARPDVQDFYGRQGALPVSSASPEEFARYVQSEAVKWGDLVKRVDARSN